MIKSALPYSGAHGCDVGAHAAFAAALLSPERLSELIRELS